MLLLTVTTLADYTYRLIVQHCATCDIGTSPVSYRRVRRGVRRVFVRAICPGTNGRRNERVTRRFLIRVR